MKEGIAPPLTTTVVFVSEHLPSSQDMAQGNYKGRAVQHCQFQAFFTMLPAWHGPAPSFSSTCGTRNRIRSVVMAELSGWEQGVAGSVVKMLGISKAAPPCLQLWCSHYLLAVSLAAIPEDFSLLLSHILCQCYTGENSHASNSLIGRRMWNADNVSVKG